ncbi:electron transfer flavoprotein subunit alpha/FixB family protein [Robertkochia solimangrovi]|uniref:electron transfer flavoprotein subunit alpha/FixB family protein n=1 Tax=Robertkochia solimangrovi TaxID=2213046 RepID=UPI0011803D34|nr:electron transfer flavoprotein subunit alpha/FixB family protein [Robertkochia solimangrovi]TRZ44404.1 electron transfer flavoprotein subunit alpha/FixB family protein [Robertkochia solimangrovi]
MSVLVYTESENGKFKKTAFEAASYASEVAKLLGTEVVAVAVNADNPGELAGYGVDKTLVVKNDKLSNFNEKAYADILAQAAGKSASSVVILSSSANAKYLAPVLAVALNAGYASNVIALPESTAPFTVKRTAFTNKAFSLTEINTPVKVLGIAKNSYGVIAAEGKGETEEFSPELGADDFSTEVVSVDKVTGKVSIADAEIVVSGGRGLKGPENWGMIEELADVLGAATACSKPVSDLGWRPHGEHVGQTGKPVASNLYIAVGISGAIQHLAGINASKVKVVINNDPEAPFFKAADYGVVGDAFDVVPRLTEKLKEFKANNA